MEKKNNKKLLIVWINYKCGFKVHNDYIEVTDNYNIRKVLENFKKDLDRFHNIRDYCIINIMEV